MSIEVKDLRYVYNPGLPDETVALDGVSLEVRDGEILAMVNLPEFNLNEPYELQVEGISAEEKQNLLNKTWRNGCINDTYEPGSTFKVITAAADGANAITSVERYLVTL